MDQIIIEDLEVQYRVGVPDAERRHAQRLLICLTIEHPFAPAAASDDLSHTIDYAAITQQLLEFGQNREWRLIERLANDIANLVIDDFKAHAVTVEIKKFIIPQARHVAVRLHRTDPSQS